MANFTSESNPSDPSQSPLILTGPGAENLAALHGLEMVNEAYFSTGMRHQEWEKESRRIQEEETREEGGLGQGGAKVRSVNPALCGGETV